MKTRIAAILLLSLITCHAQWYKFSTNLSWTNTIAASATITYTGTNYFDATRYRNVTLAALVSGSNTNTNTVTFTFLGGTTPTNWQIIPRYSFSFSSLGTNTTLETTNIDVMDFGYLKPLAITSSLTNSLTNASLTVITKDLPRN